MGVSPLAQSSPFHGHAPYAYPAPDHAPESSPKRNVYVPRSVRSRAVSSSSSSSSQRQSRHEYRRNTPLASTNQRSASTPPAAFREPTSPYRPVNATPTFPRRESYANPTSPYRSAPISPLLASPGNRKEEEDKLRDRFTSEGSQSPAARRRLLSNGQYQLDL